MSKLVKLEFVARAVEVRQVSKAVEGDEPRYILRLHASGTKRDAHNERMSRQLLELMAEQANAGTVILKENHHASLRMGTSILGEVVEQEGGEIDYFEEFELDPKSSDAMTLIAQMTDPEKPYRPDCSVNVKKLLKVKTIEDGSEISVLLPGPETWHDHTALTPPNGQAYPDAELGQLSVAKSLEAAIDRVMMEADDAPSSEDTDMLTPEQKKRAEAAKAAATKARESMAAKAKAKADAPTPAPEAKNPEEKLDPSGAPDSTAAKAGDTPAMPAPSATATAPEGRKDEGEAAAAKDEAALAKGGTPAAPGAGDPPGASAPADDAAAKADASCEDATMGYGSREGCMKNVGDLMAAIEGYRNDSARKIEDGDQLADHLYDELSLLLSSLDSAGEPGAVDAAKAKTPAPPTAINIAGVAATDTAKIVAEVTKHLGAQYDNQIKQLSDAAKSLEAQVKELSNAPVQRVPARFNDPNLAGGPKSIREALQNINDPHKREQTSAQLVTEIMKARQAGTMQD